MLWQKQKIHATIVTETETIRRTAFMVVLANASKYGTGATINPEGKIDDGLMEVVIVRKLNFWGLLNMLIAHRNFDKEKVEIISAKSIELSVAKRAYFQVDGEYRGKVKKIGAKVLPACLQVMTPAAVEAVPKVA
jgi:diacylglycerol kinase (ATP)